MTTRYAEPVAVPKLREKLGALYLLSAGVHDDAALAALFPSKDPSKGQTGKSVRNWIYGEGTRPPSHVPAARFPRLVQIFKDRLPNDRTLKEVQALMLASSERDLVLAFLSGSPQVDWITRVVNASPSKARVVVAARPGLLGITTRRRVFEEIDGRTKVPVGRPFLFELDSFEGALCVVQWGESGWFGLDIGESAIITNPPPGLVRIPSVAPFFEEGEPGARRYVFIRRPAPFPPDVHAFLSISAKAPAPLDATSLVRLAHVLDDKAADVSSLDVAFTGPPP